MPTRFFILYLFFTANLSFGQSNGVTLKMLSGPEKMWVLFHPFTANKARKLTTEAIVATKEMKNDTAMDGDPAGGQVDAFRHGYWMALLSSNMCWKKALSLGRAHEKGNFKSYKKRLVDEDGNLPDSVSGAMDLYNNTVGASIGCNNKSVERDSLRILVKNAVLQGRMKIIYKNSEGIALDSIGNPLDTLKVKNLWNVPKYLVYSNFPKPH